MGMNASIMPPVRAPLRASGAFAPALRRLVRIAGAVAVTGFALFALTLLAVRYLVFPRVEAYRDTLTATLSAQLGQPVEIASLATGWDGWNPKLVIHGLRVLDRGRGSDVSLVELPEVALIVAWTSLPRLELHLKELVIERPRLAIRRDRAGLLSVAGLEFDPALASDDSPLTDWILRQREIVIRDALITWNDDLRNAPQLVLDRVQLRLENRFGHHRFGLTGAPPPDQAAPLDVRGDVRGGSIKEWKKARGQFYVRMDYANVEAWREWLPLPPGIASGKGALRVWFEFAGGEAREIVADVELADVKAKLADTLPELDLAHVSGRIGWRGAPRQREVFTRGLSFVTAAGLRLDPTNFTLSLRDSVEGPLAGGSLEFDQLQLEPLRILAIHLPLTDRWRTDLARFAPRGTLAQGHLRWDGPADAPSAFDAAAEFANLAVAAQDAFPGVSGVSGSFDAKEKGGQVKFSARNGMLELPRVFAGPLPLDSLQGAARWERLAGRTRVDIQRLEFANAHASGNVAGTYRTMAQGAGEIDLTAQLTRADATQVYRYLPKGVGSTTHDWLHKALTKGEVTDARLKLAGDLAHFPFADGKGGQFIVTAKVRGAALDYAHGWPAIEGIDGDLRFEGVAMTIDAARGHVFGAELARTRATIPDLRLEFPQLTVDGSAAGPGSDFLRFVAQSPVDAMTGHLTDGAKATGNGHLDLKLELALGKPERNRVAGEYAFGNGGVELPGVPKLSQVNGKFAFTENDVRARDITAEMVGGPAKFSIANTEGRVRVSGSGTANLAALRREYAATYVDRVSGVTDWNATVIVRPEISTWVVESTMKGGVVDLPPPLGKAASDTMALRIERREESARPDEDLVEASYGSVMQAVVRRKLGKDGMHVERALLSLGRAMGRADGTRTDRPGIWVRGELPALNIDDWLALRERDKASAAVGDDAAASLGGVDLDLGELELFGRRFNDFKVVARRSSEDWKLDVRGREIAGTATWSAPGGNAPNGRIVARLSRFAMPAPGDLPPWGVADKAPDPKAAGAERWPEIDIEADSFSSKGRDLGTLAVVAEPHGAEWRIEKLALVNDSGRIDADGAWRSAGRAQQTRLEVALDAKDAGAFLARFGYPDAIRAAPTTIRGQLDWSGAPTEFDYPTLNGTLRIAVGQGRFTRIEPGFGKLLGVVSLQALPRRMSLDFQDVFSEGFAFDEITGNVRVANGVMSTDNLALVGPAAKVDIVGDADLARETQRLTVRVQPSMSGSVSAGAALLFLANPIVGAAVAAGSLLAQKMLKDPIDQLFSYQYMVTGGWSDPVVTRSGTALTSVAPGTPGTRVEGLTR
jgi:uncharacterized protein (TIGR02099 family)